MTTATRKDDDPGQGQLDPLDLVDIALLLNYERTSFDPRFRGAKLREAILPGQRSTEIPLAQKIPDNETFFAFYQPLDTSNITGPDTPFNILPASGQLSPNNPLNFATPKQLETYFYRPRGHDGCYTSVLLLQYFFDLFPPSYPLRIRHGVGPSKKAPSYTTTIDNFRIMELTMFKPHLQTSIVMIPRENGYRSNPEDTMSHAVARFTPSSGQIDESIGDASILDMSSLQFGDAGRGPGKKGQGLFALDTAIEFDQRLDSVCQGTVQGSFSVSHRMNPHRVPTMDKWLREVAAKVKGRWEARDEEKWCGHCGTPAKEDKRCAGCKQQWYCCKDHQAMAWGFHKHYCSKST